MVDHITDTKTATVNIILHGICEILNVVCPTSVEANTSFTVTYNCHNKGATDTCYGKITIDGNLVSGTRWDATINAGATRNCSATIPGIATNKSIIIEVGYTTV